jgi:lipid A 3-O-deacylase
MLTALHGSGVLHGRGEAVVEDTSRITFTLQIDFGENISSRKNQNLKLAVKVVHTSSAGLGEYNPGVNVTVQFSLGYSWWK